MKQYSTNLTDKQWQVIEKIINPQERKRKHSLRNIMNAILYLLKTGCQWRMIPRNFAPRESVYYYFSKWSNEGIIERLSYKFPRLAKILADGGYRGSLAD
ncbi:transposase [Bacteroides acidifaciens]|uniref:transposase n=2 Tax=Bacteroides acidifaciens TaxID=85831 RepID=UPI00258C88A9|nr:transposase [Bacteroides acidifaciens]